MDTEIVKLTKLWIERFVIGLRLCPFAHFSFYGRTICYEVSTNNKIKLCLMDIMDLALKMRDHSDSEISNSFVIFDKSMSFEKLLLLKEKSDVALEKEDFEGMFQTVVFHPDFQFAGENFYASGNFINRSPLPMLHILRVDEVTRAINATPDVEEIPFQNKKLLEDINIKSVSEVFEENFMDRIKPYI